MNRRNRFRTTPTLRSHAVSGSGTGYYFLATFFLPATVLRLPLRVRLLVRVRWPRKGKPLR